MFELLNNPLFWFALFIFSGPGIEKIPVVRKFREEQAKHPRFTEIDGHKTAKWLILLVGWLLMFVSGIMTMASFFALITGK